MPKYTLKYFNTRGFGETARMVFAQAGVEYEDVRFERDQWTAIKPTTPFGQVPLLEVDGFQLTDSQVIARYLAKEFGMAGKNKQEEAVVDMYAAAAYDLAKPCIDLFHAPEDKKDEMKKKFAEETAPKFLNGFEKALAVNSSGFLVGDGVTWADFVLFNFFPWIQMMLPAEVSAKYPKVQAHQGAVGALPKIAEWIKKRPVTDT